MKFGTPLSPSALRVMLLGSGELGKEVLIALQRLGVETIAVDRYPNAPGHQVAHRAGDHVVLALEIVVVFVKFARNGGQRPHDVLGHGGFFCDDEGFAHAQAGP